MFFVAVPPFWFAMMLILVFALNLGWLPTSGNSTFLHYILPMITLGMPYGGKFLRITRSTMLEVIRSDYIRTAQAKGQGESKILWSHAFRNAAIPIVATVGNQVGRQLGGALIIENVFGIPGVGKYIGDAVAQRNFPSVQGGLVFLAFIFCVVNLLVDLSFTVINPRLKSVIVNTQPGKLEKWIVSKFSKKKEVA
jgi:peptide/nickel transport system permease protein